MSSIPGSTPDPTVQPSVRTGAMEVEQAIVARAREGDADAFRTLVRRYEGLVGATVTGMLGTGPEADDVGQETFIRFFRALPKYRGDGGVAPYLTRIAINLCLSALNRRKKRSWWFRETTADLPEPYAEIDDGSLRDTVRQALDSLRPEYRAVVVLRLIDGYSTQETADMLDIPLGTVLSRLSRAQQQLREKLGPHLKDL